MADTPDPPVASTAEDLPTKSKGEAAAKVFSTTELMENILLNLSTRQLFGVRRTHKAFFHETIEGSTKLQRAMCLEPDPAFASQQLEDKNLNPLIKELLFVPPRKVSRGRVRGLKYHSLFRTKTSEDGVAIGIVTMAFETTARDSKTELECVAIRPRRTVAEKKASMESSWRKTILSSAAPPTALEVDLRSEVISIGTMDGSSALDQMWEMGDDRTWASITLGDVVDCAARLFQEDMEMAYFSDWDPEDENDDVEDQEADEDEVAEDENESDWDADA